MPEALKPAMPAGVCDCDEHYVEVKVKDACHILYPASHCGCRRQLFEMRCANQHTFVYDGTEHGLFHFSDDSCVFVWLLYQYADQFCKDGKILQAFVHGVQNVYDQHKHRFEPSGYVPFCSVTHFRQVYLAFASKMDRQWLFRCPECGDAPPVLVGDAKSESIQKQCPFWPPEQ